MHKVIAGACLGLALLPPAAMAQNAAPPMQTAPPVHATSTAAPADPVVCRYYYHEGLVIRRPVCLTAHEWERQRLFQQRLIREFQMDALIQGN
ncbi:MAG: hypothetical protein ACREHF_06595 [Rhizomicrobium sp.]